MIVKYFSIMSLLIYGSSTYCSFAKDLQHKHEFFDFSNNMHKDQVALLQTPCTPHSVTHTPGKCLEYIDSLQEEFAAVLFNGPENLDLIKNLVEQYEKKCTIFLLGECTHEGNSICPLSRSWQPIHRQTFEDVVSSALAKVAEETNKPITYTSFGTGGAFTDLVIITKLFQQKPKAEMTVHLIDLNFRIYVYCCNMLKNNRAITDSILDISLIMNQLVKETRLAKRFPSTTSDEEISKMLMNEVSSTHVKYNQIVKWVEENFPQAKISLFLHATSDDYVKYLETYNKNYPDVLAAIDIDDEHSAIFNAIQTYAKLCARVFKRNDQATGFLLGKGRSGHSKLISAFASQLEDTQEEVVVIGDNELASIYFKVQAIKSK